MNLGLFRFALVLLIAASSCTSTSPPEPLSDADRQLLERGRSVYQTHCRPCHMPNGNSPIKRLCFADGEWKNGSTLQDIQRVITEGVAATQMRPFGEKLSADEIDVLSRYVKSLEAVDP